MNDVYLHIGPVKTGSTYLQDVTWRSRAELARQGMLHAGESQTELWLATNDVQDCAFVHFEMPEAAGAWNRVRDRVLRHDGAALVSHEVLGMSTAEHVRRIVGSLEPARLHLVVMARGLAAMLPSTWQEKIKMVDPPVSWEAFLDEQEQTGAPWSDTASIIDTWADHIPRQRIHILTVPPPGAAPRLLLERFCAATGLDPARLAADGAGTANASIDRVQIELLRRITDRSANQLDRRAQRQLIHRQVLPNLNPPRREWALRLPGSARGWVERETERRITRLSESGCPVYGDLNDLRFADGAYEPGSSAPPPDTEVLREALDMAITALYRSCPRQRVSHPNTSR